jgi:hypothetical protein
MKRKNVMNKKYIYNNKMTHIEKFKTKTKQKKYNTLVLRNLQLFTLLISLRKSETEVKVIHYVLHPYADLHFTLMGI